MKKNYKVADLYISMDGYGRIEKQAALYEVSDNKKADINIDPYKDDLAAAWPYMSDDDIEYMATERDFYTKLIPFGGFRLHSSAVVVDDKAYLFSADSGTGKSTHTSLWLDLFGENAYILNDDKPAVRYVDGKWYAYGTPWSGKHDISVNKRVELAGIAMLERSETNEILPYSGSDAVRAILAQSNKPKAMKYRIKLMELLEKLFDDVPIWKLKCNMNQDAAIVSYEAMSGKKFEVK